MRSLAHDWSGVISEVKLGVHSKWGQNTKTTAKKLINNHAVVNHISQKANYLQTKSSPSIPEVGLFVRHAGTVTCTLLSGQRVATT